MSQIPESPLKIGKNEQKALEKFKQILPVMELRWYVAYVGVLPYPQKLKEKLHVTL